MKLSQLLAVWTAALSLAAADVTDIRHAVIRQSGDRLAARNPGQAWWTSFDGRGFTVSPDHGHWSWGLALCGQEREPRVSCEGGKVSYCWNDDLTEWFLNDPRGLEQGWTFSRRPETPGPLSLTLDVHGGLLPVLSTNGAQVAFHDGDGRAALNYGGLKAWDANGEILATRFESAGAQRIRIVVEDGHARYPVTIDPVAQQAYLKASNTGSYDGFGSSVAISGNTAVVGAPYESSDANGVNGSQHNEFASNSGAAYVFVRSGGTWAQQAYLKASNTGADDSFGWSVAISGDTVVVGAHQEGGSAGAAYVFVRSGSTWTQQAYLKASNAQTGDLFGSAVAVAGDTLVVGANREASHATGVNGDGANNSAGGSGAAYVFVRNGTAWTQQAYLKASDTAGGAEFGSSVAVSGDTVMIGAPLADGYRGVAYVFKRTAAVWSQQARLTASNAAPLARFGYSVAVSGDLAAAGSPGEASNATGINGNASDTSATNAGAVYVFSRSGVAWTQQAYLKASNTGAYDAFGKSISLDGSTLVAGAPDEDSAATGTGGNQASNAAGSSGAAYLFGRSAGVWNQYAYFKASNTESGDEFGDAVAISGDLAIAGAARESSPAFGIDGSQSGNGAFWAGAAYTFVMPVIGAPEIAVWENTAGDLLDGGPGIAFGTVAKESGVSRSFRIRNLGTEPLAMGTGVMGGANPTAFAIDASGLPSSLAEGEEGSLRITLGTTLTGNLQTILQVMSNDPDESSFDIPLSANSQPAAGLFASWATGQGLSGAAAGADAEPFDDGVENVLKYAFNLHGNGPDLRLLTLGTGTAGLPLFQMTGSGAQSVFRLEYLRRKGSGLTYLPKVSTTLAAGSFVPMTGTTTITDVDATWERVVVAQPRNPATTPRSFARVEVTLP